MRRTAGDVNLRGFQACLLDQAIQRRAKLIRALFNQPNRKICFRIGRHIGHNMKSCDRSPL